MKLTSMKISFIIFIFACLTVCCCFGDEQAKPDITGDFNNDRKVNLLDFSILSSQWELSLPWYNEEPPHLLIAHWRLDGDATDSTGQYNGTVYGDPVWVTPPYARYGSGALLLDGHDYISIEEENINLNGSFTISAWIKTPDSGPGATIISKGDTSWKLGIKDNTGNLYFSCTGLTGDWEIIGTTNINDNQWHHVAGVYDRQNNSIYLYIDDTPDAQGYVSGDISENDYHVWIGGNSERYGEGFWFNGLIDEVRVYNYALAMNEIFKYQTYHVDFEKGNDNNNGLSRKNSFKTIQKAIYVSDNGDTILVWPGIYTESIIFYGKAITLKSASNAAIIQSPDDFAVSFYYAEQSDSVIENFVITNSEIGIFLNGSSPTIKHISFVYNLYAVEAYIGSNPEITNSIFWHNYWSDLYNDTYPPRVSYCCIERFQEGPGNICSDPLFADPNNSDYHLLSSIGRYVPGDPNMPGPNPERWITDNEDSPCIDAGDPNTNPMCETTPNGARINMGAFGNTPFASKSPWPIKCDINYDAKVDIDDLLLFVDNWLKKQPGGEN